MPHELTTRWGTAWMELRADTSDWNTVWSCLVEDEYVIPSGLTGWALDIGAHVGGATVALCLASPELHVVAVEPLPENLDMLRRNVEANGLAGRVVIVAGAVAATEIRYDFTGEGGPHHRYIGNAFGPRWSAQRIVTCDAYTVDDLRRVAGVETFSFAKVDCEGGEWGFLGPACACIETIVGEWHPVEGHVRTDVVDLLPGFRVTFTGPEAGPGGFRAESH